MKKVLAITLSLSILSFSSFAQVTPSFGIKGGMTSSNLKYSGNLTTDPKIGFYAGLLAELGISENFAVQPEAFYALQGAKFTGSFAGVNFDYNLNLSYVSVPILLKYKNQGLSIIAGPQISFLVAAKEDDGSNSDDIKDQFKSTEFAGVVGAGYTTLSGFGFDARYQFGLSDISDNPNADGTVKLNAFTFGIHYFFNRNE